MHIIFCQDLLPEIREKNIVLELDRFRVPRQTQSVTAYCVLEGADIQDLMQLSNLQQLHHDLMKNFRLKNWNYCVQSLEHLRGKWRGQMDSFYDDLSARIQHLQTQDLDPDWDGTRLIEINDTHTLSDLKNVS